MANNCLRYGIELISDAGLLPEGSKGVMVFVIVVKIESPVGVNNEQIQKGYVELQEYNTDTKK